jgi:O-antigen/teichoic acid export membrane protein
MNPSTRLVVNTIAQNVRTIINVVLSLYSTRIVMHALGLSDYGIYMLVAGIVTLLPYLVNALITTTQRHLSFAFGHNDVSEVKLIFANSYLLHWLFGGLLALLAISLVSFVFDYGFLNIEPVKVLESKYVYFLVLTAVFFTFITAPFRSLLIAHENIVYISIVDVLDGVLKLALVFCLFLVEEWRLPLYALIIAAIQLFNLLMLAGYGKLHYPECILMPNIKFFKKAVTKKIIGFATWTFYGTLCIYIRNQGFAVALNRFFGTVINAAYGVATQVFSSTMFLSEAIVNAVRPQVVMAEGSGNRQLMLDLALKACKYCFLISALCIIPLIFEVGPVLRFWLDNVPPYADVFCRILLLSVLCDQITIGLNIANTAIGKIRNFTILVFTTKALSVPVSYYLLVCGESVETAMLAFLVFELLSGIIRVPYLMHNGGMRFFCFIREVIARIIPSTMVMCAVCYASCHLFSFDMRFLVTGLLNAVFGITAIFLFSATEQERNKIKNLILNI